MSVLHPDLFITILACVDSKNGMSKNGKIPWKCPEDQQNFKLMSMGKHVIMGRTTFEDAPTLKGRVVHVLSRGRYDVKGLECVHSSLEAALSFCSREVIIAGGLQVYEEAMNIADKILLTRIPGDFSCDQKFPEIPGSRFKPEQTYYIKSKLGRLTLDLYHAYPTA